MKEFFKNLWRKLRYDELGQWGAGALPPSYSLWGSPSSYGQVAKTLIAPKVYTKPPTGILAGYGATQGLLSGALRSMGATIPPYIPSGGGYTNYQAQIGAGKSGSGITKTRTDTGIDTSTDINTENVVDEDSAQAVIDSFISDGGDGGAYDYYVPQAPDLSAINLSEAQKSQLGEEARLATGLEFAPAFIQAGKALTENERLAERERNITRPEYERAQRETAAVVATSIADWAQSLNAIGRFQSGQYGGGSEKIMAAGDSDRANLEIALNRRLEEITTRETDYTRDIEEYKIGLEKEQGLKESLLRSQYIRDELNRQVTIRQQMFTNEMDRAGFIGNMNSILWNQEMEEKKFSLTYEAQRLENQILSQRISGTYNPGGTAGAGSIMPEEISRSDILAELYSGTPWALVSRKIQDLGLNPNDYRTAVPKGFRDINGNVVAMPSGWGNVFSEGGSITPYNVYNPYISPE